MKTGNQFHLGLVAVHYHELLYGRLRCRLKGTEECSIVLVTSSLDETETAATPSAGSIKRTQCFLSMYEPVADKGSSRFWPRCAAPQAPEPPEMKQQREVERGRWLSMTEKARSIGDKPPLLVVCDFIRCRFESDIPPRRSSTFLETTGVSSTYSFSSIQARLGCRWCWRCVCET